MNPYETEKLLGEYLLFHYGKAAEVLPYEFGPMDALNFPARTVWECIDPRRLEPGACALDLGCAVGRSSFELARVCKQVIGIDFSASFIRAAARLQAVGSVAYRYATEGDGFAEAVAEVSVEIDRSLVRFEQGDACALRQGLPRANIVHMANLVDRLPDPEACLASMKRLVLPGGQLVITSPYTWLEEFTPRDKWLSVTGGVGGLPGADASGASLRGMRRVLEPDFVLTRKLNLPFLIREHARKFQWSVAEATVWLRS